MADATTPEGALLSIRRELRELITALERRVPHVERLGELDIARAAAALKISAELRLATIEAEIERLANGPTPLSKNS
jgi:hypothetical protein